MNIETHLESPEETAAEIARMEAALDRANKLLVDMDKLKRHHEDEIAFARLAVEVARKEAWIDAARAVRNSGIGTAAARRAMADALMERAKP